MPLELGEGEQVAPTDGLRMARREFRKSFTILGDASAAGGAMRTNARAASRGSKTPKA